MAINIQYPGSIAAMGQVAIQGGEYAGQQQALQNQLAVGGLDLRRQQLAQQGQQFNADMNFRRNAMLFNDYQQQRNFAQQASVNRDTQIRGIRGNLISQQMANQNRNQYQARQFAFGASQDAVQFEQRKELLGLQNEQNNQSRDLEFKRRQEAAQFEDELTRERFEYQYSFQQQKEIEKYENALHEIEVGDFSPEEKRFATNQLRAKMMGIQPTPRALQQEFPEGKGIFDRWWDGDFFMSRDKDGNDKVLGERKPEVKTFINPVDGSLQSTVGGDVMTLTESPFDKKAKLEEMKLVLGDLSNREILVGSGENATPRPMTTKEKMEEYSAWENHWDSRKKKYIDERMSEWRQQEDAKIMTNQQRIDSANAAAGQKMLNQSQYQSSPGRSEMIMPQQPQQPSFNMEAVRNAVRQGVTIPPEQAEQAGLPQPRLPEHYQQIPDGTPYYDLSNGRIKIKGEDGGFSLDSPKKIGANQRAALDKWKEIVKRDESGKYRGMRIEDK